MLSDTDLKEAAAAGAYGVKCALAGETGKMIAFHRVPGAEYQIEYITEDVSLICNQEKTVPAAGWKFRRKTDCPFLRTERDIFKLPQIGHIAVREDISPKISVDDILFVFYTVQTESAHIFRFDSGD